jgi:insulysin
MLSRRFLSNFPLSIKTPQLRDRKFEKLKLENGLSAFLISDPNTTNVSAALSCDVGSWNDGKFAGTAHFLEHMLFLGTKKYPSSNDYEQFIFDNGGSLNGYTANDHSLYYFNHLNPNSLAGGLDRFSRFFHEPLFDPTCVERERNAVHEEYKKNIESDGWRILHVKKELAHQSHPISQFNTGNLDTMTFSREYLMDWYENNYSAEKMNLVVLGKEPLSELSLLATDLFSGIPKRNTTGSSDLPRKIWDSLKGQVVWIETIKDIRELSLSWEIPHSFIDLSTKTASVLSGIIGHEGRQSILHFLKEKGWAEGLSAGPEHHGLQNASFTISISLTKEGIRNWKYVVEIVNEYLQKLLNVSDMPLFLFEESNKMSKIAFEFQQRNADIAITYCEALRKEQIETFPLKSMLISEFDQNAVLKLLTSMTLKDCHICVATKETPPMPLENQEKWMFANYSVFPLKLNSIHDKIYLPAQVKLPNENIFIPSDLDLVKGNDESIPNLPVSLRETKDISLYYYPDKEFQVPESYYHIRIKSAVIKPNDPESIVLANLYLR